MANLEEKETPRLIDEKFWEKRIPDPVDVPFSGLVWKDETLKAYKGFEYPCLSEDQLITLGENWLIMLYEGVTWHLAEVTIVLALHIFSTESNSVLINPSDLQPFDTEINLVNIGNDEFLKTLEKYTGLIKSKQTQDTVIVESVEQSVRALTNVGRKTQKRKTHLVEPQSLLVENPNFSRYLHREIVRSMRKESKQTQVRFYAFMAAITCRLITKTAERVQHHLTTNIKYKYCDFYYETTSILSNEEIPKPCLQSLRCIKKTLSKQIVIRGLLKGYLTALSKSENSKKDEALLEYTLLVHTKMHGLKLVALALKVFQDLKDIRTMGDFIKAFFSKKSEYSLSLLCSFLDEYLCDSPLKSKYVFWARALDSNYFASLALKHHSFLAGFMIAVSEHKIGESAWNCGSLRVSKRNRELIRQEAEKWLKKRTSLLFASVFRTFSIFDDDRDLSDLSLSSDLFSSSSDLFSLPSNDA